MIPALIGALALSAPSVLNVPFVPQSNALCGGAAVAMVYRYWGDAHAGAAPFAPLVDRRAGGIADTVLAAAVRQRGWTAVRFHGSLDQLRASIAAGRPVIVLLGERANRYHYVVVVGTAADRIVIHDPSWGPSRSIGEARFVERWRASGFASLLVLPPPADSAVEPRHEADSSRMEPPRTRCDGLLAAAVASVERLGIATADGLLQQVRSECPDAAGPLRELAGVRFGERRWSAATALARQALALDPADSYAWDVLGSSLFMQNDVSGALRAWNQIGRPRLDAVRITGLQRTRYQRIVEALRLEPGGLLTADTFERARRRLNELPDRTNARLALRPEPDGFATVEVVVHERIALPHGAAGWSAATLQAGLDREVTATIPGSTGQGEIWSASWRWWQDRPRVAMSFAAPAGGRLAGVWRVDAGWESQAYAFDDRGAERGRESRTHGALSFIGWATSTLRYSLSGGIDAWDGARRDASLGLSLEHRWLDDRVSTTAEGTQWIPLSGDKAFSTIAGRVRVATARSGRWVYRAVAGAERTSDAAPLAVWSGAGEGRVREPLLRAHPLLDGGTIDALPQSAFGRSLLTASFEARRWFDRPQLPRVAVATFGDAARSSRSAAGTTTLNVDIGAGLRIRVPGWRSVLRLDVAHGVRDGRNALTFGWTQ